MESDVKQNVVYNLKICMTDYGCCPISERGGVKVCCQGYKLVSLLVWQYDMRDNPIFGQFF
jgi:hypothetical protein